MPTTLVPTVHGRLSRCNERVYVDGLVTGAEVVLSVDGIEYSHYATGPDHTFNVPWLHAHAAVNARQDTGQGFTPWSPAIIVEDAARPTTSPSLPFVIGARCRSLHVSNVVPGSVVEVSGHACGRATANGHGEADIACDSARDPSVEDPMLRARMIVGSEIGPYIDSRVSTEADPREPVVHGPLFACQTMVVVRNIQTGACCRVEMAAGVPIADFSASRDTTGRLLTQPLVLGRAVRAQSYLGWEPEDRKSEWSRPEPVIRPDARITPEILEPLNEGDRVIRVDNQIPGASLVVRICGDTRGRPEEFGPRPASTEKEIAINRPLSSGSVVTVVQSLCGISFESNPVAVCNRPQAFRREDVRIAPVIIAPLYHCARAVQVSNLYPGALVSVFQDGVPVGVRWAGLEGSVAVRVSPVLTQGSTITAAQEIGGIESALSEPVAVQSIGALQPPRVLGPVAYGDTEVRLSNVTPGSLLILDSPQGIIGQVEAAETIVRLPTFSPAWDFFQTPPKVIAVLGSLAAETQVELIASPSDPGTSGVTVSEAFRSFGTYSVPPTLDGDPFDMPLEGQLYFPTDATGAVIPGLNCPLVIVAHGYWDLNVESYKGYDYLARHLVEWGMVVFSLNMDAVNQQTYSARTCQYARAEIILHAIDELLQSEVGLFVDRTRIGLVGHSMGGEGVAVAQYINQTEGRGYGIRAVASIAPTHYRPEVALRDTKYMQMYGSMDYLTSLMTGTDAQARFSGFRTYDRAWRTKTFFWIYRALHPPFNRVWGAMSGTGVGLSAQDHELLARSLINAFFQDALLDRTEYGPYMEGTTFPASLSHIEIHTQHSAQLRCTVIDNFGDQDDQLSHPLETLDRATNTRGLPVNAAGAGLTAWADIEHTTLTNSPHNTKGVELSWNSSDATYVSNVGSIQTAPTDVFAVRVAQFYPDTTLNPVATPLDLFVTLSDGINEATVRLGAVAEIPYPGPGPKVLCPMRTVRLPMDGFQAANPTLDLSNIQRVTLYLTDRATGHILADDVEFSA